MAQTPSETLNNRSYLGLLLSQFLAAFNDQATHILAIFFASDLLVRFVGVSWLDDKAIITLVTASFISPFFFFSPIAGVLADKYSKRNIIVFWKLAEVAIMAVALLAFALPHFAGWASPETLSVWAAVLAISIVFLMGTHSAFFVPAKYGVMPELLHPAILSRGNGLLEGTSFTANILGITFGGAMYSWLGSDTSTPGQLVPGREWVIGLVLLILAVVGAVGAFLIVPLPPAAPNRRLEWQPWVPLKANLKLLRESQSLTVAVVGIAFFTFMTLFLRQILLYQGETDKELQAARRFERVQQSAPLTVGTNGSSTPQEAQEIKAKGSQKSELRIALLIGFVGLGVGIGCSLAGQLSGKKLELGLVPIGAVFLVITTASLAVMVRSSNGGSAGVSFGAVLIEELRNHWPTVLCLVLIGAAAGLYIVPFYTLLQQRAPKGSKGNLVATSNFLNVAGGLLAVVFFYFLTFALEAIFGLDLDLRDVKQSPELLPEYISQMQKQTLLPRAQFLFASCMTAGMIALLFQQRPDFLVRSLLWLRMFRRGPLLVEGLGHVPGSGSVVVVTDFRSSDDYLQFLSSTDRYLRFVPPIHSATENPWLGVVRWSARATGVATPPLGRPGVPATREEQERVLLIAERTLQAEGMLAVTLNGDRPDSESVKFLTELVRRMPATLLPVHGVRGLPATSSKTPNELAVTLLTQVNVGEPLAPGTSLQMAADVLKRLASGEGTAS